MVTEVSIDAVKPAAYNPRKITEEQRQELCESIRRFGLIVPIPVNRKDDVIIAGHQRTEAARLAGIQAVPAQYVEGIDLGDEIKFNQIHNATESGTVKVAFGGEAEHGKFDVAVCDSVLNSVDSMKAERSAIDFLNLMAGDRLFISGRPLDSVTRMMKCKKDAANAWRAVEFLDADNFSANYRSGKWYFQHYHGKEQIEKSLEESGFEIVKLDWQKRGNSWQCEAVKARELPSQRYIDAIDFEFDLPLPNGRSYRRNEDVEKALGLE